MLRHQYSASSESSSTASPVTVDTSPLSDGWTKARPGSRADRRGSGPSPRVKREIEIERAKRQAAASRLGSKRSIAALGSGDRHRLRRVERADFERAADLVEKLARRVRSQRQRRHAAVAAGALLLPAARDDDPPRFCQRQRAGRPSRGDLADAVADIPGADAEPAQCLDDADLDREEQRLGDVGVCHRSGIGAAFETARRPTSRAPAEACRSSSSTAPRKAALLRSASRPMPANCAPLPENTKASLPSRTAVPAMSTGDGSSSRNPASVCAVAAGSCDERDQAVRMMVAPARGARSSVGARSGETSASVSRQL